MQTLSELEQHAVQNASDSLTTRLGGRPIPNLLIVLGSGFRSIVPEIGIEKEIPLADIKQFRSPMVAGHGSTFLVGSLAGHRVAVMTGRCHLYEGHSVHDVVRPIRAFAKLGGKAVILTNASGSLDPAIHPGSLIMINDHLNLTGTNCTAGVPGTFGETFVDMGNCYDRDWRRRMAERTQIREAVYAGALGPTYETPAEARMLKILGAHVVGMSTVQEAIAARQMGLKVLALSLVSNMSGSISAEVGHAEVLSMAQSQAENIQKILTLAAATA